MRQLSDFVSFRPRRTRKQKDSKEARARTDFNELAQAVFNDPGFAPENYFMAIPTGTDMEIGMSVPSHELFAIRPMAPEAEMDAEYLLLVPATMLPLLDLKYASRLRCRPPLHWRQRPRPLHWPKLGVVIMSTPSPPRSRSRTRLSNGPVIHTKRLRLPGQCVPLLAARLDAPESQMIGPLAAAARTLAVS